MRNSTTNPVLALLAAAGLLFAAGTATAQGEAPGQAPTQAPTQAPDIDVSDQDVGNFADAYVAVQTINQEYAEKLQNVEEAEKATEMQQEARDKMEGAVEEAGLSLSDYQEIAQAAGQDEELRADIQEAVVAITEPEASTPQ